MLKVTICSRKMVWGCPNVMLAKKWTKSVTITSTKNFKSWFKTKAMLTYTCTQATTIPWCVLHIPCIFWKILSTLLIARSNIKNCKMEVTFLLSNCYLTKFVFFIPKSCKVIRIIRSNHTSWWLSENE